MKMEKRILKALLAGIWLTTALLSAQADPSDTTQLDLQVKRYTLMQQYAPDLVVPADERIRMKEERITTVRYREAVIDTLDIPGWKKRKLLRELYRTPFSDEWDKVFTSMEPDLPPE
jgi:hypothetical protein